MGMYDNDGSTTIVTVKKGVLLTALEENRKIHAARHDAAMVGYRHKVKERLQVLAEQLEKNGVLREDINLPAPMSFLHEYDTVIEMLKMSVDTEMKISQGQFRRYVQDQWEWKRQFDQMSAGYLGGLHVFIQPVVRRGARERSRAVHLSSCNYERVSRCDMLGAYGTPRQSRACVCCRDRLPQMDGGREKGIRKVSTALEGRQGEF